MELQAQVVISELEVRKCLAESGLLGQFEVLYGWEPSVCDVVCRSIANSLMGDDWRIDRLHKLQQRHGFDYTHGDRVLDAGCGRGEVVLAARQLGFDIVGVELDDVSRRASQSLARCSGVNDREWARVIRHGDVTNLSFPSNEFALVTCSQVVEHVDDPVAMARECFRCLRPGGLLALDAPEYRGVFEPHYRIPWIPFLPRRLAGAWIKVFDKPQAGLATFSYVSLPHIRGVLEAVGFDILSTSVTTSIDQIGAERTDLRRLIGDDCPNDESAVSAAAERVRAAAVRATATAFIILAQKPDVPVR